MSLAETLWYRAEAQNDEGYIRPNSVRVNFCLKMSSQLCLTYQLIPKLKKCFSQVYKTTMEPTLENKDEASLLDLQFTTETPTLADCTGL